MTDEELKKYIEENPGMLVAQAYRLGLKDKALELAPQIEQLINETYHKGQRCTVKDVTCQEFPCSGCEIWKNKALEIRNERKI